MSFSEWVLKLLQPPNITHNKVSTSVKAPINLALLQIVVVNEPKQDKVRLDDRTKEVVINQAKLTADEKKMVQIYSREEFASKKDILLPEPQKIIQRYKDAREQPEYEEFMAYFKEILPPHDVTILRAALFIHSEFLKHRDVSVLRQQLLYRYGMKALTITNFQSGGYFESHIKPLYEAMKRGSSFSRQKFLELYDDIIVNSPFAIFVHRRMNEKDLEKLIITKLTHITQYGMNTLNIHGIGYDNVMTIRKAIENAEKSMRFNKQIFEENGIIIVKLQIDRKSNVDIITEG